MLLRDNGTLFHPYFDIVFLKKVIWNIKVYIYYCIYYAFYVYKFPNLQTPKCDVLTWPMYEMGQYAR